MSGARTMRSPIPRVTITVAAIAFAGAALLSGLDRLAAQDHAITAPIHWPYARNAPVNAAYTAAMHHEFGIALPLMNQALLADPVNETMIGGLGRVRLSAGDSSGADAAFRVSAQRGWRDQVTHAYWMQKSIDAGDLGAAALHADALLSAPLSEPERESVYNALMEYDEGRNALAARLRTHPSWSLGLFLDIDHATTDELAAHADVIARTGPGVWTCQDTSVLIDRLIAAGDTRDALAARNATCAHGARADGSGNVINDPRFVRFLTEPPASQLDWLAPDSADVTIGPVTNGAARGGVQITSARGIAEQVMTQRVAIVPGTYTLTWQMPHADPAATGRLVAGLDCATDLAKATPGTPVAGQPGIFSGSPAAAPPPLSRSG
jgi:hypothetical protein